MRQRQPTLRLPRARMPTYTITIFKQCLTSYQTSSIDQNHQSQTLWPQSQPTHHSQPALPSSAPRYGVKHYPSQNLKIDHSCSPTDLDVGILLISPRPITGTNLNTSIGCGSKSNLKLLGYVEVEADPLLYVNREARGIAMAWYHEQNVEMQWHEKRGCHIFTRGFRPKVDVLYIPWNKMDEVDKEHHAQLTEGSGSIVCGPDIRRIAVSGRGRRGYPDVPTSIIHLLSRVKAVFFVIDTPPNLDGAQTEAQPKFEVGGIQGPAFS